MTLDKNIGKQTRGAPTTILYFHQIITQKAILMSLLHVYISRPALLNAMHNISQILFSNLHRTPTYYSTTEEKQTKLLLLWSVLSCLFGKLS